MVVFHASLSAESALAFLSPDRAENSRIHFLRGNRVADRELGSIAIAFATATSSFLYHYARLIEMLAGVEGIAAGNRGPGRTLEPSPLPRRDQPTGRRRHQHGAAQVLCSIIIRSTRTA